MIRLCRKITDSDYSIRLADMSSRLRNGLYSSSADPAELFFSLTGLEQYVHHRQDRDGYDGRDEEAALGELTDV